MTIQDAPAQDTPPAADARTLTLSRVYAAPRALVWSVWTDPTHVAAWWGPFGPDKTTAEIEPAVGGTFAVAMTAPDGSVHPARGVIRVFDPPRRLVIEGMRDAPDACGAGLPPGAKVTLMLEDENGHTRLTLTAVFPSADAREAAATSGYTASWTETLDALGPYLAAL